MNYIDELLTELTSRLPELAWKLGKLNFSVSSVHLPHGLFRSSIERGAVALIDEIKFDIQILAQQKKSNASHFLAERVLQKISVLVSICQTQNQLPNPDEKIHFGLNKLSTRQQWIQSLEKDIEHLTVQYEALEKRIKIEKTNTATLMQLSAELGQIERRLTLTKEQYQKALT